MLRRIVVVNKHEWLAAGWSARSFAPAAVGLEANAKVKGVEFDPATPPVPIFQASGVTPRTADIRYGLKASLSTPPHEAYAVTAMFDDEDAVQRLKTEKRQDVVGVFADPTIGGAPGAYCSSAPQGTFRDVRSLLKVNLLRQRGCTGKKVRVAIVDTGIHGSHPGPDGHPISASLDPNAGYSPRGGYKAGTSAIDHGTMVGFDVLLAAPDAVLLDYALLQSAAGSWSGFLSDALAAFADLIDLLRRAPGPLVVNNSWGLFDRGGDSPIGTPENYSANPNHPFNQITGALAAAGADVVFAAGNCGADCPDGRCGGGDTGPGSSIHGANSHPSVLTVAAVTTSGTRLGYSSQGPGGLSARKPDLSAYSHFDGSKVYRADGGTSAASPVAAGFVAALRQGWPHLPPAVLRAALQKSSGGKGGGWSYDIGYGVLNTVEVLKALDHGTPAAPRRKKSVKAKAKRKTKAKAKAKAPITSDHVAWMLVPTPLEELAEQRMRLEAAPKWARRKPGK